MHYMIDIETLSTRPNAHILSVGAVAFDLEKGIQTVVHYALSGAQGGRHVDPETVAWWAMQGEEARKAAFGEGVVRISLLRLCELFDYFFNYSQSVDGVWSRSPDFDLTILRDAYRQVNCEPQWSFREQRDCRTLEFVAKSLGWVQSRPKSEKQAHNAAYDATEQALDVIDQMRFICELKK